MGSTQTRSDGAGTRRWHSDEQRVVGTFRATLNPPTASSRKTTQAVDGDFDPTIQEAL
jgi:hypothetical protein